MTAIVVFLLCLCFLAAFAAGWYWRGLSDGPAVDTPVLVAAPTPVQVSVAQPRPSLVSVCLQAPNQTAKMITIDARRRKHRLIEDGVAWDHISTSANHIWVYQPAQGLTPRQEQQAALKADTRAALA
jgi:hypothetical protein